MQQFKKISPVSGGTKISLPVVQYSLYGEPIQKWDTASQAAEHLSGNRHNGSGILQVCKGMNKTALGYQWKYLKDAIIEDKQEPEIEKPEIKVVMDEFQDN